MPVQLNESQEHIKDFVSENYVAVLSTVNRGGQPHGAAIYYCVDDDMNFFFLTKSDTTKSNNLSTNSSASLVIYESKSQTTVQTLGIVTEVTDKQKVNRVFEQILQQTLKTSESGMPPISELDAGRYVVYQLTPSSIKMASFIRPDHGSSEKIFEIY